MGIRHIATAPCHPEGNGQCERIHALVDGIVQRLKEENKNMSNEIALIWACNAYNNAELVMNYYPCHLMFGAISQMSNFSDAVLPETDVMDKEYKYMADLMARRESIHKHQVE